MPGSHAIPFGNLVGYNGLSAKDTKSLFREIMDAIAEMKNEEKEEVIPQEEFDYEAIKKAISKEVKSALSEIKGLPTEINSKVTAAVSGALKEIKDSLDMKELSEIMEITKNQISEDEEFSEVLKQAEIMAKIEVLESSVARLQESDMMKTKQIEEKEIEIEANRKKLAKLKSALS